MATHLMASLNNERVQVQTVSESNSVAFKLNAAGITRFSSPLVPYVKINDNPIGDQTHGNGINVRVLGANNTVLDRKVFTTTSTDGSANSAFISYMNGLTSGIAVITSGQNMKSSPSIDAWFKSNFSTAWPGAFICNAYDVAYAATYSTERKRIIMESVLCDDGTNKGRAVIETVYDSFADIGSTGHSYKAIYDPTEYQSETAYELKRYPTDQIISLLTDYGIIPGSKMSMSCELFASNGLTTANMTTRLNLRWYNGSTLIDAQSYEVNKATPDTWVKFSEIINVPVNANGFTIVVARYPRNDAVIAKSAVRNMVFNLVSRPDVLSGDAAIGVNGIKASRFIQDTLPPRVMNLPDSATTTQNIVNINNLEELPLTY